MEKAAIETLFDYGLTQAQQGKIDDQHHILLVPESYGVKDIEKLLPSPIRHRYVVKTRSLGHFINLSTNTEEAQGKPTCFVDEENLGATTVFNLGTPTAPEHGDHKAVLTMVKTSEFAEVCRISGKALSQRELIEWLEDWRDFLLPIWNLSTDEYTGELDITRAISVMRNVTIESTKKTDHGVADFGAEKSDLEKINARGRDLPPPSGFIFDCVTYEGLEIRNIKLRLSIQTEGALKFVLRIVREGFVQTLPCLREVKCHSCDKPSTLLPWCEREDIPAHWINDDGTPAPYGKHPNTLITQEPQR